MRKRGGQQRHLDGEIQRDTKIGTKRVNVSIKLTAGNMPEWESTTAFAESSESTEVGN